MIRERRESWARGRLDWGPGKVEVLADDSGIFSVAFADRRQERPAAEEEVPARAAEGGGAAEKIVELALEQFRRYFAGELRRFELPVHVTGTPFQLAIWRALCRIPFGGARTYAQLAAQTGSPKAMRAAGQACRANPLGIVIPCHRVLSAHGDLTGYAGNQVHLKAALLDHERRVVQERGLAVADGEVFPQSGQAAPGLG